jgi:hypothetical protein
VLGMIENLKREIAAIDAEHVPGRVYGPEQTARKRTRSGAGQPALSRSRALARPQRAAARSRAVPRSGARPSR